MHSFSALAAGEDEAVALLLLEDRAHEEEEKEDQALGRWQAALLEVGQVLDGTYQACKGCISRRGKRSAARTLSSRRVGGMTDVFNRGGSILTLGQGTPAAGGYLAAACRCCMLWRWRCKAVRRRTGARRLA